MPDKDPIFWNFVVPTDPDVNLADLAVQLSGVMPLIPKDNAELHTVLKSIMQGLDAVYKSGQLVSNSPPCRIPPLRTAMKTATPIDSDSIRPFVKPNENALSPH